MKIEMGESLMLSWLRHTKHCQSVQLNWKPSTTTWQLHNKEEIEQLMAAAGNFYYENYQMTIFKNNQSFSQLLQQGEIDVLGLELQNGYVCEIYGIDIAFHEGGLNYGGTQGSVERIIKKMVRTAMIILGYFNMRRGKIIFASPKIRSSSYEIIVESVAKLNEISTNLNLNFEFRIYGNESFKETIFLPVIGLANSVADTSELFMRSLQMYNMFMEPSTGSPLQSPVAKVSKPQQSNENDNEIKIGQFVRNALIHLIEDDKVTFEMIGWLCDKKYCKETFDINLPMLKKLETGVPLSDQRKVNGYDRYWKDVVTIKGLKYIVCNDWYDRNRGKFEYWLQTVDGVRQTSTRNTGETIFTQADGIIEAFQVLGGTRSIQEITDWVNKKYGRVWKDFGTLLADMVPEKKGGNSSSRVPEYFRVLERVERGKYRLIEY